MKASIYIYEENSRSCEDVYKHVSNSLAYKSPVPSYILKTPNSGRSPLSNVANTPSPIALSKTLGRESPILAQITKNSAHKKSATTGSINAPSPPGSLSAWRSKSVNTNKSGKKRTFSCLRQKLLEQKATLNMKECKESKDACLSTKNTIEAKTPTKSVKKFSPVQWKSPSIQKLVRSVNRFQSPLFSDSSFEEGKSTFQDLQHNYMAKNNYGFPAKAGDKPFIDPDFITCKDHAWKTFIKMHSKPSDVLSDVHEYTSSGISPVLLKKSRMVKEMLIKWGAPDNDRSELWYRWSGGLQKKRSHREDYYECLIRQIEAESDIIHDAKRESFTIKVDLHRTCPEHPYFGSVELNKLENSINKKAEGLTILRRLLSAFRLRNGGLGYVQGMNYLAAMIILVVPNEIKAFWTFTALVEDVLTGYFNKGLSTFQEDSEIVNLMVKKHLPIFSNMLDQYGSSVSFVLPKWYLCMYFNTFTPSQNAKIWDMIFYMRDEGASILLKVAMGIIDNKSQLAMQLNKKDFSTIGQVLQRNDNDKATFSKVWSSAFGKYSDITMKNVLAMRKLCAVQLAHEKKNRNLRRTRMQERKAQVARNLKDSPSKSLERKPSILEYCLEHTSCSEFKTYPSYETVEKKMILLHGKEEYLRNMDMLMACFRHKYGDDYNGKDQIGSKKLFCDKEVTSIESNKKNKVKKFFSKIFSGKKRILDTPTKTFSSPSRKRKRLGSLSMKMVRKREKTSHEMETFHQEEIEMTLTPKRK